MIRLSGTFVFPFMLLSAWIALVAQTGSSLMPLVKNRSMVNVVVYAPHNSELRSAVQSHVNALRQDDWNLHFYYLDPSSALNTNEAATFRNRFGGSAWAVISPDGRLIANGNKAPSFEDFEKVLLTTDMNQPIPRLRQFVRQNPDNIDARSELLELLRASAYRRTRQQLNISQNSLWDDMVEKQYVVAGSADYIMPDVSSFRKLGLEPEQDFLIWARYAQELSVAFQDESWQKMNLAKDVAQTLFLEVCSPTMKVTFRRLKPRIEEAIANLPNSRELWKLWLHFQTVVDGENYDFSFFNNIEEPPAASGIEWPPEGAAVPLVKIFYERKNWEMVLQYTNRHFEVVKNNIDAQNRLTDSSRGISFKVATYIDWEGQFKPRLESLINLGRRDEADGLVTLLYSTEDSRVFVRNAIQIARTLNATDLADKWQMLIGGVS